MILHKVPILAVVISVKLHTKRRRETAKTQSTAADSLCVRSNILEHEDNAICATVVVPKIHKRLHVEGLLKVHDFIGDGDKVKVTLRFRGRELSHQQLGMNLLQRVAENVQEIAKVEAYPRMEGRQMLMVLAPK